MRPLAVPPDSHTYTDTYKYTQTYIELGRPRSMDMKCPHEVGRESWVWEMAGAINVQSALPPKGVHTEVIIPSAG